MLVLFFLTIHTQTQTVHLFTSKNLANMKPYNIFLIIPAIISISLFTVGVIWEISFAKYFGLLSLGYPIEYLVGLLIKYDTKKPKITLSSNP